MKTKIVELYADLYPGWHELTAGNRWVYASSQPGEKFADVLRVKITVELPEYSKPIAFDDSAKGRVSLDN